MSWKSVCCAEGPSRAELRRRRVTDSARKLFIANGFHATGMAQIAKESGVAVGQIYRDFASKEDIVAALVEVDCSRLMMYETLKTSLRAGDVPAVRQWLAEFIEPSDQVDDARLFTEILAESTRNARIAAIFRSLQDQLRQHLLDALALLAPGDQFARRRAVLADVIMTLSLGILQQQLLRPDLDLVSVMSAVRTVLDRELASMAP